MSIDNNHGKLVFSRVYQENQYRIDSATLDDDIRYVRENGIKNVIYYHKGTGGNLDWLNEVGDSLDKIFITTPSSGKFLFDGIKYCKNLAFLYINNTCAGEIDLSLVPNLEFFSCENGKYVKNLHQVKKLQELILTRPSKDLLTNGVFSELKNLKRLVLSSVELADGISFLDGLTLDDLYFYSCKNLSFKGLTCLKLLKLKIEKCKTASYSEEIYSQQSLMELSLVDSFQLESANDVSPLGSLEVLVMLGSSYFKDGHIAFLKDKLRIFNFDNKRHYDSKFEFTKQE